MATLEIQVRAFFASDEADVTPSMSITVDSANLDKANWKDLIPGLARKVMAEVDGIPLTNVRPMTQGEVEAHLVSERANDIVGVT